MRIGPGQLAAGARRECRPACRGRRVTRRHAEPPGTVSRWTGSAATRTRRCARSYLAGEGGMPGHGGQLADGGVPGRRARAELTRDRRLLTVAS